MEEPDTTELCLLIPNKPDVERDAVAKAWAEGGREVLRLDKFWRPPAVEATRVRIYGPDSFAMVLADILGLHLVEPEQDLALSIPRDFLRREVAVTRLGEVGNQAFPLFVKPLIPKQFAGKVYGSAAEVRAATEGLEDAEMVLRSEAVEILAEARLFFLHGQVLDAAIYEGQGDLQGAITAAEHLSALVDLPSTVVLDLGLLHGGEWVFIEANATWGSGLNGCDAGKVLPAIMAATQAIAR